MIRRMVALVTLVAATLFFSSDATAVENGYQLWGLTTVQAKVAPRWRLFGEVQGRFDKFHDPSQLLVRGAVGFELTRNVSVWAGYGWTPSFIPKYRDEQRPWQQLLIESKWSQLSLVNRTRFEERFLSGASSVSLRARHMVRGVYRFTPTTNWGLTAYDEFFVNLNTVRNGPVGGVDQNRLFVGPNLKLNDVLQIEAGYMMQVLWREEPAQDRINHNAVVYLIANL